MKTELVIFDMDGVIIDSEKMYFESSRLAAEELGMQGFTQEYYRQFIGAGTENMLKIMTHHYGDAALIERFNDLSVKKIKPIVEAGKLALKPGVKELLAYLKKNGIQFVLASSNNKADILYYLAKLGVLDQFELIISADDVNQAKPAPDIFNQAFAKAKTQDKHKAVVIEDSHNGILAANRAEIPVIMVPDQLKPGAFEKEHTTAILDSLLDVKEYVANLNS